MLDRQSMHSQERMLVLRNRLVDSFINEDEEEYDKIVKEMRNLLRQRVKRQSRYGRNTVA